MTVGHHASIADSHTAGGARHSADRFDGFVHVQHGRLVDGSGCQVTLRGVGLGNWLLPEGYMWKLEPGGPLAPRQIEAFVEDLVGPALATQFWRKFRDEFVTSDDIDRIAAEGFNHVRVAINSRVLQTESGALIEEGFALLDRLITWCRAAGIWVILDLHGAPGGQTGTNIDDSPRGLPELFTDPRYEQLTVDLWHAIASRYCDETVVAGYDLLNEPLPNEFQDLYATELVGLYRKLTQVIRTVDRHHVLIYEGTHWSTNWEIFSEVWDQNSMLQCHKYWSAPDAESVRGYVERGRQLHLPVYMGETGENNLEWLHTAFQLYDDFGMSWNLWPWKKMDTVTSPCSVNTPIGWDALVGYARGSAPKPAANQAWATLSTLLDSLPLERCTFHTEVVNAILHRAPLTLPAWGFSFRGAGISYQTVGAIPLTGFRADEKVSLECAALSPEGAPRFDHTDGRPRAAADEIVVRLAAGDWLEYDVRLSAASDLEISTDAFGATGRGKLTILLDGEKLASGVHDWIAHGNATAGLHAVRIVATEDLRVRELTIGVTAPAPQAVADPTGRASSIYAGRS